MEKDTILIADDEPPILFLTESIFKDAGMNVITAVNGADAIEKAFEYKPDIIITDVIMPEKNGFEVCQAIRNRPEIAHTPILILSAMGDEYNKISGFEYGADDYVTKPFNVKELKARVKALLLRQKARSQNEIEKEGNPVSAQPLVTEDTVNRLATEIPGLDQNLYGGLPEGSNILLIGPIGIGKSTFTRQFVITGLKKNERCLYVAIDDSPKRIRQQMFKDLPEKIETYEQNQILRYVDAYSWSALSVPEDEKFAVRGMLELNKLAGIISDASHDIGQTIQNKSGGRRVVDSISSLLIHFDLPHVQRFISQIARTSIAFGGVTTLFVIEEGTVSDQVLNNIKYIMDGILEFKEVDGRRAVRAASMKWIKCDHNWVFLN